MGRPVFCKIHGIGFDSILIKLLAGLCIFLIICRNFYTILIKQCLIGNDRLRQTTDRQPLNLIVRIFIILQCIGIIPGNNIIGAKIHKIRL